MTTYNTGNPLGSTSPKDLYDNAENLDHAVNSDGDTFQDRLGKSRLTYTGMENQFESDQAEREVQFDADQAVRDQEFDADQSSREQQFRTFIASSGYQFAGDYAAGIEITQYNQIIRDSNGEFWRVSGQVDLPYVTTGAGIPEDDALAPAGDAVLRQDLSNNPHSLSARLNTSVETAEGLHAIGMGSPVDGQTVFVSKFHPEAPYGGYSYKWSSQEPKANHDGSRVIAPEVPWVDLQDESSLPRVQDSVLAKRLFLYRNGAGAELSGNGCWVVTESSPPVIGATASADAGSALNSQTFIRAIQPFRDYIIVLTMGSYGDETGSSAVDVFRLNRSEELEKISSYELPSDDYHDWRELFIYDDRYLYCTTFGGTGSSERRIAIFDLNNFPEMSLIKDAERQGIIVSSVGSPHVIGSNVYFATWAQTAAVGRMDLSDPLNPVVVQRLYAFEGETAPAGLRSAEIAVYGNRVYVALYNNERLVGEPNFYLSVYKILGDGSLVFESKFTDPDQPPVRSIKIVDGLLLAGDFNDGHGVTVYDISGATPEKVNYYPYSSASRVEAYSADVIIGSPNSSKGGLKYSIWNSSSHGYWTEIIQETIGFYPTTYRGGILFGEVGDGVPAKIKFFNDRALLSSVGAGHYKNEVDESLSAPINQSTVISTTDESVSLAKAGTKLFIGDHRANMASRVSISAELDARLDTGSCISFTGANGDVGVRVGQNYSLLGFKTPAHDLTTSYAPILSFDKDSDLGWALVDIDIVASRPFGSSAAGLFKVYITSYDEDSPIVLQEGLAYIRGQGAFESIMGVLEFSAVESNGTVTVLAKSSQDITNVIFSGMLKGVGVSLSQAAGDNIATTF